MGLKQSILGTMRLFGVDPVRGRSTLLNLPRFLREETEFKQRSKREGCDIAIGARYPILTDFADSAGTASGHYFHMDLWAARRIYQAQPDRHVDIGSRVDGFIAHLLTFREVEVLDIRPLDSQVEGLKFVRGDATTLSEIGDGAWTSISCLHAAEHFGLGRYGDPLDPWAYRKLMSALSRVLAPGGRLYFAVPIGKERVEFNAHRVFDPRRIVTEFPALTLLAFSAVNDDGSFSADVQPTDYVQADHACGLFEFTKPAVSEPS